MDNTRNQELLKELAYCKCLEQSLKRFSVFDFTESGSGEVRNLMDYNGIYSKNVEHLFDSLASDLVERQIKLKYDIDYFEKDESS